MGESLFCAEKTDACFDNLDCNAIDESGFTPDWPNQKNKTGNQDVNLDHIRSSYFMGFPLQNEEGISLMVVRESDHLPKDDYIKRFRTGNLDFSVRRMAIDWIWKAHTHFSFGPLSFCLSMNYFDRFLSVYELPKGTDWTVQLLAVACLSIAAKIEEPKVPLLADLQVGQPQFIFEGKTVQRMELLILNTLKWKMQAFTPCSFIDYFLNKISNDQKLRESYISKSLQLILSTVRGIPFLEFRPSEIAAAVAIHISGELQKIIHPEKAKTYFQHVERGKVLKCLEMVQDLLLNSGSAKLASSYLPQSPNGVLDASGCLSYKTENSKFGNSSQSNSERMESDK